MSDIITEIYLKYGHKIIRSSHSTRVHTIIDFPFQDVMVAIKLDSSGTIVLNLVNFKFYNKALITDFICREFSRKFRITVLARGAQLYIYPTHRNNSIEVLNYLEHIEFEFLHALDLIERALSTSIKLE